MKHNASTVWNWYHQFDSDSLFLLFQCWTWMYSSALLRGSGFNLFWMVFWKHLPQHTSIGKHSPYIRWQEMEPRHATAPSPDGAHFTGSFLLAAPNMIPLLLRLRARVCRAVNCDSEIFTHLIRVISDKLMNPDGRNRWLFFYKIALIITTVRARVCEFLWINFVFSRQFRILFRADTSFWFWQTGWIYSMSVAVGSETGCVFLY